MSFPDPLKHYDEHVRTHTYRPHILWLSALLLSGLAVRWVAFDIVEVWGDYGFWVYDAQLIRDGQTPFIDFLGRSPLFLYLYAVATTLTGEFVATLRWFAIAWYLATAIPVYLIGLRLRGRRVAVVATALFVLTPFSIAYGVRGSSQSMALFFGVWALYALLRDESWRGTALAGAGIGLAFLARQSAVALVGGVGLWCCWRALDHRNPRALVGRLVALGLAFLGIIFAGYWAVVGGTVSQAVALFDQQVIGLVATSGRGGLPLIGVEFPEIQSQPPDGAVPIINDVCPQCSSRTARVFAHTTMAAAPVLVAFVVYLRDLTRYLPRQAVIYWGGAMVALVGYGAVTAMRSGYVARPIAVLAMTGVAVLVWQAPPLPREYLYGRAPALLVSAGLALSAGYLVRDRLLASYYFLDFWPIVCLLAGLLLVGLLEWVGRPQRYALGGLVAVLVVTSLVVPHPLSAGFDDENRGFTMDKIDRYGADLDERVAAGDPVFAGHPTYLIGSQARMPLDDPRIHYRFSTFATKDGLQWPAAEVFDHVEPRLADGTYEYVILDVMDARMLRYQGLLTDEFKANYCRVESADDLYAETGAQLYRYQPACPAGRQPTDALLKQIADGNYPDAGA